MIPKDRERWEAFKGKVIDIPTKIIHGILDPVIIKEYVLGVEEVYTQVEVDRLKGGHFICDEQPEMVASSIKAFLL